MGELLKYVHLLTKKERSCQESHGQGEEKKLAPLFGFKPPDLCFENLAKIVWRRRVARINKASQLNPLLLSMGIPSPLTSDPS